MTPVTATDAFPPDSPLYRPQAHHFRGALGRFVTGVAVVTFDWADAQGNHGRHGITVNSFTSVSMDPPLVLVSLQKTTHAHGLLPGRCFTVNVLGAEQANLAWHFAGQPGLEPNWTGGEFAPRLADALAWLECTPWTTYPGGDHTLFLGQVRHFGCRQGDALGFASGAFVPIAGPPCGHEDLL